MKRKFGIVALLVTAFGVIAGAQTFPADIQQFWSQLRTGAIAFSTGRVQTSGYLNFGNTVGTNGYGLRDLAGVMQFKDSGGAWVSFPSGGVAPSDATYLIKTANASLPNAQVMAALATGVIYNTVTTGVQSVIVCGTAGTVLIGGAPPTCSATPTVSSIITPIVKPSADAALGVSISNAAGTILASFDTSETGTNARMALGKSTAANVTLDIAAADAGSEGIQYTNPTSGTTSRAILQFTSGTNSGALYVQSQGFTNITRYPQNGLTLESNGVGGTTFSNSGGLTTPFNWQTNGATTVATLTNTAFNIGSGSAYQVNGTAITSGTTHLSAGTGMAVANVGANSCGTTAATIAGNNNAGEVTVGATGGTQCRIAFTVTAATKWQCWANDETTAVLTRCVPVDTTHADLLGAFTAGDVITYGAFPR